MHVGVGASLCIGPACVSWFRQRVGFRGPRAGTVQRFGSVGRRGLWRPSRRREQVASRVQATAAVVSLRAFKTSAIVLLGGSAIGLPPNYSFKRTPVHRLRFVQTLRHRRRLTQALCLEQASSHSQCCFRATRTLSCPVEYRLNLVGVQSVRQKSRFTCSNFYLSQTRILRCST